MEIRQLVAEEFDISTDLGEYAFQYKLSPVERTERRTRFKPEQTWGAFENGQLLAKLVLLPLQIYIHGKPFDMGGLAGVASWPENRRSGMVSSLLTQALNVMKDQGQVISCLNPFSFAYYRKFGWELMTEHRKYTIPVNQFPARKNFKGRVRRDMRDVALLDQIYQPFAQRYNGTLLRDRDWWERSVLDEDGHDVVYFSEDGTPQGYALYNVANRELTIEEFVYHNEMAREALWTYFANHDSMVNQAVIQFVPMDDFLPFLLDNPRFNQEIIPYFMARIVDAAPFINDYPFQTLEAETALTLQIEDTTAPWNHGVWQLHVSPEGRGQLSKINEASAEAELICDIQTLTTMLIGYRRPQEMYRYGRLAGEESAAAALERVIPHGTTYLMDSF
ncbi:GNAT family N-acetyltransferase [Paenibacillus motobuensis]|uniref:GNAT family N-acetyltransferase n=1 Tax=Paenibacillus TaxID=44249 RepID=UPI00204006D1|nr:MULTISPECIES: GNAT family N-acetyltransferase [Paenibacillus]MCM3042487.1 GNAT family N-acetyltransferase [Paenibacillus lutimineralis]MCM3649591.1 GNAT family N-acetyltransferase [Paenibacillus motobuensis]